MTTFNDGQNENEFDKWMALYNVDPDAFEKMKRELVQSVIDQSPESIQHRLTGLQWRIDFEIKLAKTPLAGCIKVYEMMMESVYGTGGLQDALNFTDKEIKESVPNVAIINIKDSIKKSETED